MYDSRLGRWMSLDPLAAKYPGMSPYNFVANNPLYYKDPDGRVIRVYYEGGTYDYTPGVKPSVNSEILSKFHDAVSHNMNSATGRRVWNSLHKTTGVIEFKTEVYDMFKHFGKDRNKFVPNLNEYKTGWGAKNSKGEQVLGTVYWDPQTIVRLGIGGQAGLGYFSPSTNLVHESGHGEKAVSVYQSNDPTTFRAWIMSMDENFGYDEDFDTREEKRNILKVEQPYIEEINQYELRKGAKRPFLQPIRNNHTATPTEWKTPNVNSTITEQSVDDYDLWLKDQDIKTK